MVTTATRKCSSIIEGAIRSNHNRLIEMDDHDRMDLLWEEFNEELHRNQTTFMSNSSSSSSYHLSEFGFVSVDFNSSKAVNVGGGFDGGDRAVIDNNKKVGAVVLSKVLKRLFLVGQPVKKRCL